MASAEQTPPQSSRYLSSVQMARAVAAFLVLLYHLATTPDGRWALDDGHANWLSYFEAVGFAGVDVFFVISGLVMTVTCYARLGDAREVIPFLKRRVARIYPLYWACLAAVLAIASLDLGLAERSKANPGELLASIVLWPQRDWPAVGVAWTLTYEMYFYLVFAALIALPRRAFVPALAVWAMSVLVLFPLFHAPENERVFGNLQLPLFASPLVLEFIAGCAIGLAFCRRRMPAPRTTLVLGVAMYCVVGGYVGAVAYDQASYGLLRVAVFGTASALAIYGAAGLELAGRLSTSRMLCFWGDASYSLYLTHVYVIRLFGKVYDRWPQAQNGWQKDALMIACLAACLAVAAACHVWVERPLVAGARRILQPRPRPTPAASPGAAVP